MPWKCSCDKHPAYCCDWNDDEVVVCSRKNAASTPHPFSNKRSSSQFSHERRSPTGGKKYFSEMYFFLSTREERFRIFRGALLKSSIFFRQCETQTVDHHAKEKVTTIVRLFSNPKNNSPQSVRSLGLLCPTFFLQERPPLVISGTSHTGDHPFKTTKSSPTNHYSSLNHRCPKLTLLVCYIN